MASDPLSVNIPQPQIPFLNQAGGPSREWLYYMLTILNRTGGVQGISSAALQQQAVSSSVIDAFEDVDFPPPFPAFSMASVMDDAHQPTSIAAAVLMALALSDDAPRPALNPILASLLVSDAA